MNESETIHVWFGLSPLWMSTIILVATYVAIMTERMNRAVIALLAGGLRRLDRAGEPAHGRDQGHRLEHHRPARPG